MARHAKPQEVRPDLGCNPAMHPYPGFPPCAGCGETGGYWVTPMGASHRDFFKGAVSFR